MIAVVGAISAFFIILAVVIFCCVSGGSPEKPVGTVCFGFYFGGKAECGIPKFEISKTMHFGAAGRQAVRNASVNFVFETLAELLRAD